MSQLSIIDWDLYLKLMEKKYGKTKIDKNYLEEKTLEEKFLSKNKYLFEVNEISSNGDVITFSCYLNDRKNYFYDTKNKTLHNDYPLNDNNIIKDDVVFLWVVKSIYNYIEKKEKEINDYKIMLKSIVNTNE